MCDDVSGKQPRFDAPASCVEVFRVVFPAGPLIQPHHEGAEAREKGAEPNHDGPPHPLVAAGIAGEGLETPNMNKIRNDKCLD